ncbi:MAG: PEP-CTERM sorting domain-containing protein [Burkholderiales bacterium]|nr:PEP-CTERM sorting domain-containing protein [Burkholderiales bacterium]
MHTLPPTVPARFALKPLALAAAVLLAPPVLAQSFSQSGFNSTSPTNLLPFVGNPTSLDFTGNRMYVGAGGLGSFSALAGAILQADSLTLATGSSDIGNFSASGVNSVTGGRTQVLLGGGGQVNRLEVGNWGNGTLTVSGGALVDATVNAAACTVSSWCYSFIGNAAGSTATVTITGVDAATGTASELKVLRYMSVGHSAVFTTAGSGSDFGTPGGTTNATVSVLAGGKLSTERAMIGDNNASPDGLGTEKANGTVIVSGAGSTWTARHNSVDNQQAGVHVGFNAGATGTVTVSNGGRMTVDSSAMPSTANAFLNIGQNGGKGTLTVTGAGSVLELINGGAIQAGRSNSAGGTVGQGTFSVLAGATAMATFLNVGRDGSTGTATIDGSGSQLMLSGVGPWSTGGLGPAAANIGWIGSGQVTVSNGGQLHISDGGADTSAGPGSPHLIVGRDGGTGTLMIKSGGLVEVVSTSISPAPGAADNFNPFGSVGRGAGSTGTIVIEGGGKLRMTGNAVSTPTFRRGTDLNIGGESDSVAGGTGTVSITGPGSELRVTGADAFIAVGRNGTGTLDMKNGALVETMIINVGRGNTASSIGNGTLLMDNSTLLLNGQQTGSVEQFGAGLTLGNRGGTGQAALTNGSVVTITNMGSSGAGLNLGGTGPNPLGTGTLTMDGGSTITIVTQPGLASATIGRDGTGTVALSGGSTIDIGTGTVHVGRMPTGLGTASLSGASKILAGLVNIGGSSDTEAGGTGSVSVDGLGSELRASGPSGFIGIGRSGSGALDVTNQGKVSAIVLSVGRGNGGSGLLNVDGSTVELSGQQTTGNLVGAALAVGIGGGNGIASIGNGSVVNITNLGSSGASVTVGGSVLFPQGTGTLALTGGSQLNVTAASAGLASVTIGRNGTGTAIIDASAMNAGSGSIYIGREVGSVGTLVMSNGSTLNAGYVGVGVSQPYDKVNGIQSNGGTGIVVMNNSTINTGVFEVGANGIVTGHNGTIDAVGDVIVGGTLAPGNSPGRIRIMCNLIMLAGSKIVLEISGSGSSLADYQIDQLVIGDDATFDLASAQIEFSFLGNTNPNTVSALGGLNLDYYLRAGSTGAPVDGPTQALSTQFTAGQTWSNVIDSSKVTAVSDRWDVTSFTYGGDGSFTATAVPVPEPSTWGMLFVGLAAVGAIARRRRAASAAA